MLGMRWMGVLAWMGLGLGAAGQSFTLEQVLSAPFCSDLRAAPHGDKVAWVANEKGARNVWVAELAGGKWTSRRLTKWTEDDGRDIDDLTWTPDGKAVLFTRGGDFEEEGAREPNPAELMTGVEQDVELVTLDGAVREIGRGWTPAVSPDGKTLVYVAHEGIEAVDLADPAMKKHPMFPARGSVSDPLWSPDGKRLAFVSGRGDHGFVGVYDVAAKTLQYMAASTGTDDAPEWSPDGTQIAFVREVGGPRVIGANREGAPWSIVVADAATGSGAVVWTADSGVGSVYHSLSGHQLFWTAEGSVVFPWERDGWEHLYALAVGPGLKPGSSARTDGGLKATSTPKLLTPGEGEVSRVVMSADRKRVVFDWNHGDIDRRHVWESEGSHTPKELSKGDAIEVAPVVTGSGAVVAMLSDAKTPTRPAVIAAGKVKEIAPELEPAEYPAAKMVAPEQVIFAAADGMQIHGQLWVPRDGAKKHPALVFFHGGSRRQMLLGYNPMGYYSNAYAMNEYLVSQGYVVLSVNYRSGTGYGMEFREALNYGVAGASEYNDVVGAGLYLRGRSDVDAARIGLWGGSYGGYLTALGLARGSAMFAAGVDFHGVHDWTALRSNLSPEEKQTAWLASPIADVKLWKSPVLLIQGDDDRNVPFNQMVRLSEALGRAHVPFEEKVFPDEIHGFLLWKHWVEAYGLEADFFARKMKGSGD